MPSFGNNIIKLKKNEFENNNFNKTTLIFWDQMPTMLGIRLKKEKIMKKYIKKKKNLKIYMNFIKKNMIQLKGNIQIFLIFIVVLSKKYIMKKL